jgi:glycosyltransferase involved in cell wall biosynthesis
MSAISRGNDQPAVDSIGQSSKEAERVPLVTIGMPVYNGARYLEEAVASLQEQTEGDFILHISDNCSTDETPEICARLANEDPRIRYAKQEVNIGVVRNFESVRRAARSPFFMWAACDDLWDPDFIEESLRLLDRAPSAIGCAVGTRIIDASGTHVKTILPPDLAATRPVARARAVRQQGHYAIYGLFRRHLLSMNRGVPEVVGGDQAFVFGLALRAPFATTQRVLWSYRGSVDPSRKPEVQSQLGAARYERWRCMLRYVAADGRLSTREKAILGGYILSFWLMDERRAILFDSPQRVKCAFDERRYMGAALLALRHAVLRPSRGASEIRKGLVGAKQALSMHLDRGQHHD